MPALPHHAEREAASTVIQVVNDTRCAEAWHRRPVLLDFCGAFERRMGGTGTVGPWCVVTDEIGAAVAGHRESLGLTMAQAADAAMVTQRAYARVEQPSGHRLERTFHVWRVLTWVMSTGGPPFYMGG